MSLNKPKTSQVINSPDPNQSHLHWKWLFWTNLPRNVVGVLREDAVSLEACHDVTSRGGEGGGKETQLSAVTRGASVMSAPSRFHPSAQKPSASPGHSSCFPHLEVLDEHRNLSGLPQQCQMLRVSVPSTDTCPGSPSVPVPRPCPAASRDSSRLSLRGLLGCSGSSATPPVPAPPCPPSLALWGWDDPSLPDSCRIKAAPIPNTTWPRCLAAAGVLPAQLKAGPELGLLFTEHLRHSLGWKVP